ncbi:MAG TPA: hypothetical protein VGD38_13515 [Pyrinomonadaceae bacterium]
MPRCSEASDAATDDNDRNVGPRVSGYFDADTVAKLMTEDV